MTPAQRDEELAFARAMLVDPSDARLRAVYGDFLEEIGEVERAGWVRTAEEWEITRSYPRGYEIFQFQDGPEVTFALVPLPGLNPRDGTIMSVGSTIYRSGDGYFPFTFSVCPDGSSPDDPHNWAWLRALAVSRGLVLPSVASRSPTHRSVHFGPHRSGLPDVGYTLDGRRIGHVPELHPGSGIYGVEIPTDDVQGRPIVWDSGEDPPAVAVDP